MGKEHLIVDKFDLREIICEEMYSFFNEVGISWLYHLKDRKKDPDGFAYNRFRLPANRIALKIEASQRLNHIMSCSYIIVYK